MLPKNKRPKLAVKPLGGKKQLKKINEHLRYLGGRHRMLLKKREALTSQWDELALAEARQMALQNPDRQKLRGLGRQLQILGKKRMANERQIEIVRKKWTQDKMMVQEIMIQMMLIPKRA